MCIGITDKDMAVWPWRIVFCSNFTAAILTLYFAIQVEMTDLYWLHIIDCFVWISWFFNFFMCLLQNPGVCLDNSPVQLGDKNQSTSDSSKLLASNDPDVESGQSVDAYRSFDSAMNVISRTVSSSGAHQEHLPNVCYTCRICKPLRSKHCKIQRQCVQKFDHFCPFVGSTIGRDNYKYFLSLLLTHAFGAIFWEITAGYYVMRVNASWALMFFMIYSCLWLFVIFGLLTYHTQLVLMNLTTNEHINFGRYTHMRDAYGNISNPFDKHSVIGNIIDAFFPSTRSFYTREEVMLTKSAAKNY